MEAVDLYCERIGPSLWGEPLNATTNAALLLAAWLSWRYARRSNAATGGVLLLIALVTAFGIGSTLFHTFANTITRWLDVLPIAAFMTAYVWLYLRRVLRASAAVATISTAAFVAVVAAARQFHDILNGSLFYAPAFVVLIGIGLAHLLTAQHERRALIGAAGALLAAIVFRTIDNSVCTAFPIGTHFLWHLLAALTVYLAMRALIANWPTAKPVDGDSGVSNVGD